MSISVAFAVLSILDVGRLALVAGGAAVGAAVARAVTRRRFEAELAAEHRAHGVRVRQLEAARLEALAELGRAATELAERALGDGRKADRRRAITPEPRAPQLLPPWVPVAPFPAAAGAVPSQTGAEPAPAARLAAEVLELLEAFPLRVEAAADGSPIPPLDDRLPEVTLTPAPPPARPRHRAESWSSPLVPLPRGAGR